jgi:hypothetical protein
MPTLKGVKNMTRFEIQKNRHNTKASQNDDLMAFVGLDANPRSSRSELIYQALEVHETEHEQLKRR